MFLFVIAPNIAQASRELTQQSFGQKNICWFSRRYVVHVINDLPSNSELRIHCASGDDDLGYHTLLVGYDYDWSFCDIPHVTLFVCHLRWDLNSKERTFEAFQERLRLRSVVAEGEVSWTRKSSEVESAEDESTEEQLKLWSVVSKSAEAEVEG
ncbi:hypothetical protein ACS0TY_003090 [Phlomoides rotata]